MCDAIEQKNDLPLQNRGHINIWYEVYEVYNSIDYICSSSAKWFHVRVPNRGVRRVVPRVLT